jgi:hypothetical protein
MGMLKKLKTDMKFWYCTDWAFFAVCIGWILFSGGVLVSACLRVCP